MLNHRLLTPTVFGSLLGLLISSLVGFIYIVLLQEPDSAFYVFACLAFLIGPGLAGLIATLRAQQHKIRSAFAATSIVFGIVVTLFIIIYGISIRVDTRRVQIPRFCDGTYTIATLPSDLTYVLPDGTKAILLLSDAQATIVAKVDQTRSPRPITLFLINTTTRNLLGSITFPNDSVAVAMDMSTVYIFHEAIGHSIQKATGKYEPYFLTMDAYGANTDGFFETTGVFSSWSTDGSVKLRPYLIFNGIAQGCHIAGDTQHITKL